MPQARPQPQPQPQPRELAQLPFAAHLTAFAGRLSREADVDTAQLRELEFDGTDAGSSRFMESTFEHVSFTGCRLRRSRFNDVWLQATRWSGTDAAETQWLDAEFQASILAGIEAWDADMRRVSFFNCKFNSVNLRGTKLNEVHFVDCIMQDVDFAGATMDTVAFPGTSLDGARFDNVKMQKVDLRGIRSLGISSGIAGLKGAMISTGQLVDLAAELARDYGILVKD
jgi:uncharacterized protein YjbI with pentapeptide repeats